MIEKFAEIMKQAPAYLHAFEMLMVAMIALFVLIPGDQPEKAMQGIVDFVKKFSRKPSDQKAE